MSLFAEIISNDVPFLVIYKGKPYFPLLVSYPETAFGGDFDTETDYLDPYFLQEMEATEGKVFFPPNRHSYNTINLDIDGPVPSPPTSVNYLGTDDRGRDVLARLLYGFRLSILFGFTLTLIGTVAGIIAGAVQGFFGGRTDLFFQRFIEIWGAMAGALPVDHLRLDLPAQRSATADPAVAVQLDGALRLCPGRVPQGAEHGICQGGAGLGVGNFMIMYRHLLPNGMTPVITFLPFRVSASILALTSLDFLGLGVPPSTPSLGELLAQGKANIEAWWLSLSAFSVLILTLVLLIFIGEACVRPSIRGRPDCRRRIRPARFFPLFVSWPFKWQ